MIDPHCNNPDTGDGFYFGFDTTGGDGGHQFLKTELYEVLVDNRGFGIGDAGNGY